jgi:glycosyltransferase involved in cell wall biosynthesis
MKEFLYVIINDKIYSNSKDYFCENKDIQSTINYLSYKYYLIIISRYSAFQKPFRLEKVLKIINLRLARIFNFFIFLFSFPKKKKILIISITPFNFIIFFLFKFFFDCKFYLYLRSNGYEEYESILGKKYIWIYDFMFKYITKYSEVISCHKRLYNKKCHILYPSELNLSWTKKIKRNYFKNDTINILYVGRFKIEKGIYSLLNIFSKLPINIKLTLVGNGDPINITDDRIKIINFTQSEKRLINIYDSTNIFILPSYTEAHPKVIDEALSRMRPVIIFNDIKYVIQNRFGIFSVNRDVSQLIRIFNYIKKNNQFIFHQLKKNKLPQRNDFLESLHKILCQS